MTSHFRELVTRGQHSYIHMEQIWHSSQWKLIVWKNTTIRHESWLLANVSNRVNIWLILQNLTLMLSLYTGSIIQSGQSVIRSFQIKCQSFIQSSLPSLRMSLLLLEIFPARFSQICASISHTLQVNQSIVWKCQYHWNFISFSVLMLFLNSLIINCFHL